jgi:Laminin G domain
VGSASVGVVSASGAKIAEWEMNEGPNATTMHDSSGSVDGKIGSAVVTDVVVDGRTGYRWPAIDHDVVNREHLVTVNSSRLNPGRGGFAVIVRFNTGHRHHQHIIQKGNSGAAGGLWKLPIKQGKVGCFFLGSRDRSAVFSRETVVDGAWHTVRCERRRTGVTVIVDGGQPKTNDKWTGKIENTWPTSIGGKWFCRPPDVHCDYYVGLIDRVVVKRLR